MLQNKLLGPLVGQDDNKRGYESNGIIDASTFGCQAAIFFLSRWWLAYFTLYSLDWKETLSRAGEAVLAKWLIKILKFP